ncbi:hypothetical protein, partial [Paenibacillus macerans]|uniref:hypothetical protein n=1 Tax=Paenibacillus macerans TaxID=44252 RepID=UPI001C3F5F4C
PEGPAEFKIRRRIGISISFVIKSRYFDFLSNGKSKFCRLSAVIPAPYEAYGIKVSCFFRAA